MQTYIVLIACVILLLCLFFRVPVYISVFAAALTYFLFQTGSSPAIIAQRTAVESRAFHYWQFRFSSVRESL